MTDLATHCETWFDVKLVETWMHAQDTYALVIVCMSARKKAPVNLLMCTFELVCPCSFASCLKLVLIPYCWSVALVTNSMKKKKDLNNVIKVVVYPSYNDIHDIFLVKYLAKGAGTEAK